MFVIAATNLDEKETDSLKKSGKIHYHAGILQEYYKKNIVFAR